MTGQDFDTVHGCPALVLPKETGLVTSLLSSGADLAKEDSDFCLG